MHETKEKFYLFFICIQKKKKLAENLAIQVITGVVEAMNILGE